MVDVGHNNVDYKKAFAEEIGVSNWHSPHEVLGECGVAPDDVTHVFITHAHFDHMGGIDLFPNAKFYVQERELTSWVKTMALGRRFRSLMGGIDPSDILRLVELAREGRLVTVDGVVEDVVPYIDLHPAFDTHTAGSQYVVVRNSGDGDSGDTFVLAGDLIYKHENLHGGDEADPFYVPVGLANGSQTNLIMTSDEMLKRVGGEVKRVIPVHEDRLKDFFPSRQSKWGQHIVEISLRAIDSSAVI
jgi:glyoxylase-like metal-dependent hydrolase (beta-lactamase superfamily II)